MTLSAADRREIRDLVDHYAVLADSKDYPGVAGLFLPDGVLAAPDPPEELGPVRPLTGRAEIEHELSRLDAFTMTLHGVLGHSITSEVVGAATGHVNAVAHHVRVGARGAQDLVWHLRYLDRYAHHDGQWRFARRAITIEVIDSRPVDLTEDSPFGDPSAL